MACGRPVIALGARRRHARPSSPGVTGLLVDEPTAGRLCRRRWPRSTARAFDPAAIRAHAERFGTERFESAFAGHRSPRR